jgi:hypothetical protein
MPVISLDKDLGIANVFFWINLQQEGENGKGLRVCGGLGNGKGIRRQKHGENGYNSHRKVCLIWNIQQDPGCIYGRDVCCSEWA